MVLEALFRLPEHREGISLQVVIKPEMTKED